MLTRGKYLYINSAGDTKEVYSEDNPPPSPSKADIGLSNVANERQYSASYPPPYPSQSGRLVAFVKNCKLSGGSSGNIFTGSGYQFGYNPRYSKDYRGTTVHVLLFGNITGSGSAKGIIVFATLGTSVTTHKVQFANGDSATSTFTNLSDIGTVTSL